MSLKSFLLLRNITRNRILNISPVAIKAFSKKNQDQENGWGWTKPVTSAVIFGSVLIGSTLSDQLDAKHEKVIPKQDKNSNVSVDAGAKRPDLPTYSAEEVFKHDSKSSFWVTYKHGVYDITTFLPSHPGGEQILNAGGLSVEPFWNVYGMHKTDDIFQLLEKYRIGNLPDGDVAEHSGDELWAREPRRDARLVVRTAKPFNAEIAPQHQIEHFDTPNELFYVRQHMPVPELDAGSHSVRVRVVGRGGRARCYAFTLAELQRLPRRTVRAALMCAGNRRSEMNKVAPVKGIGWAGGAVSSARWGGVLLRDVLLHCGVDLDHTQGKHVILTGADVDATGENFSTSIPLSLAADPSSLVLLATHMNGAPLPADHGRPLRAVVPGAPAVRSVKWLVSITVSEEESSSHWHQKDYRAFNPSTTWETADFASAPPVYSMPVTSAICSPADGDTVKVIDGCIEVKGYAYSGGGAKIVRVDVSADRGRSWVEATPTAADAAPPKQHYAWTLWRAAVPAPAHGEVSDPQRRDVTRRPSNTTHGEMELWVKATDSNFNTQPEKFDDIWNIRGILSNAYHKIKIKLTS